MTQKITLLLSSITLVGMLLVSITTKSQELKNYEYMNEKLNNMKAYTMEVLDAMPADKYSYKPTEEVRSFGAQAFHIIYSTEYINAQMNGAGIAWEPGDENRMNKAELKQYFDEQFSAMKATIMNAEESPQFTDAIIKFMDHLSHHRGQMVTYLRMNDIAAPQFR